MNKTAGLATLLVCVLTACGGGGSGSPTSAGAPGAGTPTGSPQPVPTAPTAAATIYNECTDAVGMTMPTGYSRREVYAMVSGGKTTGEVTTEEVIDGPGVFEGQNAIQTTATSTTKILTTDTSPGYTTVNREVLYYKIQNNGLVTHFGADIETVTSGFTTDGLPIPGNTTKTKEIYSSDDSSRYLTLKLGESIETTSVGTRTTLLSTGTSTPVPFNYKSSFTYVAREAVNVLGRTFDTCKYTEKSGDESSATSLWLLVGKGTMVKTETSLGTAGTMQMLLQSGTYNGVAL